jgi:hypothetical protein
MPPNIFDEWKTRVDPPVIGLEPRQAVSDWISRITVPDMYPRKEDPFRPPAAIIPPTSPGSIIAPEEEAGADLYASITRPGMRPVVYQRGINYQLIANTTPIPLMPSRFEVDTVVIDVFSTALNSVFWGYGSGITVNSGQEIVPGAPVTIGAPNTREQWELQRSIEILATITAFERGLPVPGDYKAPRVVFDASALFIVAPAATAVAVLLFFVPEMQ